MEGSKITHHISFTTSAAMTQNGQHYLEPQVIHY